MLHRARNTAGDVQFPVEFLSGNPDITVEGQILQRFGNRSRGSDRRSRSFREIFDELHVFLRSDALTRAYDTVCLNDGRIGRDLHCEIKTVADKSVHELLYRFFRRLFSDDLQFAFACFGKRLFRHFGRSGFFFLRRPSHDVGADDDALNFVGAFVDGRDLRVAVHAFNRHSFKIAVAAEDLESVVGDFEGDIGGVLLGHRRFDAVGFVVLLQFRSAVYEESCSAQLRRHIRELEGDSLLEADGLSELDTFLRVRDRFFISALSDAESLGCDPDTSAVKGGHRDLEALSQLAEEVFLRNLDIVENQFRGRG